MDEPKILVKKFIKSFGDYEIPIDEIYYNESKFHGINMRSFLEDFAEDILQSKQESDEIEAIEFAEWCQLNGWSFHGFHKDWFSSYLQPFKTTKELYEIFKTDKTCQKK